MGAETGLITTPGDDDIDLQTLKTFALNISWCSKALLEVFYDTSLAGVLGVDYTLEGDEAEAILYAGQLTVPKDDVGGNGQSGGDSQASQKYVWYSKQVPMVSGADEMTKLTFIAAADPYGLADIKIESTVSSGVGNTPWFTWYDTSLTGTTNEYPDPGFLNRSRLEYTSGAGDFTGGQNAQLKITITTDPLGWGGSVDYVALFTDPNLFE